MNQECDYGCGQLAKYTFKNGRVCCSEYLSKCPAMKIKNSNGNKGRKKHRSEKFINKDNILCVYGCGQLAKYLSGQAILKPCCSEYYLQCPSVVKKAINSNTGRIYPRGKNSKLYGLKRPKQSEFMKKNNPMYIKEIKKKHAEKVASEEYKTNMTKIIKERWMSDGYREKYRKAMEKKGLWIPRGTLEDFNNYKAEVKSFTSISMCEHYYEINPYKKKIGISDYHIDHIYSIVDGFKNKISPKIIGSHVNLQILPAKENISKYSDSWIFKEELLKRYEDYENSF